MKYEISELRKIDYLAHRTLYKDVSNCWTGIWNEMMVEWKMEWSN